MKQKMVSLLGATLIGMFLHTPLLVAEEALHIDGSSTVYPLTEAVAEEYQKISRTLKVPIGLSGTGGGFKKFCNKEIEIVDASRPIKASEEQTCRAEGVEYVELPVAYDALTVVINPHNTWAESMTTAELKKLWEPQAQGKVMKWSDIRPEWPQENIRLFGPGVDSGTFDYFTETIVGKEDASRADFTPSEDDNVLVHGVANDKNALGFFGYSYYYENKGKVKAVAIDDGNPTNGAGAISPSPKTVKAGTYVPLSRPLFIYVNKTVAVRPEVKRFVEYYLKDGPIVAQEMGFVPLPKDLQEIVVKRFGTLQEGSLYAGKSSVFETPLAQLLRESPSPA